MLLTSKMNSLLRFSQSWEELTQRGDNRCSGFVEGAQNRWFSSKIFFFKCSQFNILLGSKRWRVMLFNCWYPHMPARWNVRKDVWCGRFVEYHDCPGYSFWSSWPRLRCSLSCCLDGSAGRGFVPVAARSPTQSHLSVQCCEKWTLISRVIPVSHEYQIQASHGYPFLLQKQGKNW